MSGSSHDYICYKIEQELGELDALMADLAKLTHSLEWMDSGDISDDDCWNDVAALIQTITDSTNELKAKLLRMIGM